MFAKLPKKFIFFGVGLIVLLGGAFAIHRFAFQQDAQTSDEPTIQTATVRQGDIVLRAS